jgi:Tfp pilus assembly protein PilV
MIAAQTPSRHARRAQTGSTFVELMLAVLVVSTTLVASTASMQSTAQVYHFFADGKHEALMLAQEIHEAAKVLPWSHQNGAEPVFGDDVLDLWDLDGKTFDPPRSADYDVIVSHIGWSQSVEIKVVDMQHPEVEVDPDTFVGSTLVDLKVTVKNGEEEIDVVDWWLSPPMQGQ